MTEKLDELQLLTCKVIQFRWYLEHNEAFHMLKKELITTPVFQYYDQQKPSVLQTDAFAKCLKAVLLQENKPVYYM